MPTRKTRAEVFDEYWEPIHDNLSRLSNARKSLGILDIVVLLRGTR